jgi:hypothetical protein
MINRSEEKYKKYLESLSGFHDPALDMEWNCKQNCKSLFTWNLVFLRLIFFRNFVYLNENIWGLFIVSANYFLLHDLFTLVKPRGDFDFWVACGVLKKFIGWTWSWKLGWCCLFLYERYLIFSHFLALETPIDDSRLGPWSKYDLRKFW